MKGALVLPLLALGVSARALAHNDSEQDDFDLEKRYGPSWDTVYVTTTRTVTNYCGCGIPGVPTIGPVVVSTTTVISGTTTVIPTTTYTTTLSSIVGPISFTTTVVSGTTTVVPVTTTMTTSTTTPSTMTTTTSSTTAVVGPGTTTTLSTSLFTTGTTTASVIIPTSNPVTSISTTTTPTTSTTSTSTSTSTSTTTTSGPVVTDAAYISTVVRHHNVHRLNHSAPLMSWDASLAATAAKIAASCQFKHQTDTDGGGYGQNIGAGYPINQMGAFITEGLYNSEFALYDPSWYGPNGSPPANANVGAAGHLTQVVWVGSTTVGCYTQDCSATGMTDENGNPLNPAIPPYYTVCNYKPPGNVGGGYQQNVLAPKTNPTQGTVDGSYGCPSRNNCVGANS